VVSVLSGSLFETSIDAGVGITFTNELMNEFQEPMAKGSVSLCCDGFSVPVFLKETISVPCESTRDFQIAVRVVCKALTARASGAQSMNLSEHTSHPQESQSQQHAYHHSQSASSEQRAGRTELGGRKYKRQRGTGAQLSAASKRESSPGDGSDPAPSQPA